jgi:hypothetical protein
VPCTDQRRQRLDLFVALCSLTAWLAGCGNGQAPVASPPRGAAAPTAAPATAPMPVAEEDRSVRVAPAQVAPRAPAAVKLPPPARLRSMNDLQLQFARRLVAAHPGTSYTDRAPDRLLAIPVLEVELHADGSVRRIHVLRKPTTGNEATALAIAAVRRAAPYGDVSRLPKPWKVVETFLFDDQLRFKPRTLDID